MSGTVSPTSAWFFQRYLPSAPGATAVASGNAAASLTPVGGREVNIDIWHDPAAGDNGAIARQVTASPGS